MNKGGLVLALLLVGCGTGANASSELAPDASVCSPATAACDGGADARQDDGGASDGGGAHDGGSHDAATCPTGAPAAGSSCQPTAAPCVYDPKCPPNTGPMRKLSFACEAGVWVDTLGPGPACEGPGDGGPDTRETGCTGTGGTVVTQSCCTTGDFPNTCLVGACSCAPSSSVEVRACACPKGTCFTGAKCL